jgi:hypothetical protein
MAPNHEELRIVATWTNGNCATGESYVETSAGEVLKVGPGPWPEHVRRAGGGKLASGKAVRGA